MINELPIEKVKEIAREVTANFDSPDLPSLEEIAWAFPVSYRGFTGAVNNRILSGQECNAWQSLLLFKNLKKTLETCANGKFIRTTPYEVYPAAESFGDSSGIFDASHLGMPYDAFLVGRWKGPNSKEYPEPLRSVPEELFRGFWWGYLPKDLAERISFTTRYFRKGAFKNQETTREYLTSVRNLLINGTAYLTQVVENSKNAKKWPQMARTNLGKLKEGDYVHLPLRCENETGIEIQEAIFRKKLNDDFVFDIMHQDSDAYLKHHGIEYRKEGGYELVSRKFPFDKGWKETTECWRLEKD